MYDALIIELFPRCPKSRKNYCWGGVKSDNWDTGINFLMGVAGLSLRDRVKNLTIKGELRVELLLLCVERRLVRWFGHLTWMPQLGRDPVLNLVLTGGYMSDLDQLFYLFPQEEVQKLLGRCLDRISSYNQQGLGSSVGRTSDFNCLSLPISLLKMKFYYIPNSSSI